MRFFYTLVRIIYIFTWPLTGFLLHNSERVRILVMRDNSVLLQKTSYGKQLWSLPGGGVDRSESYLAAAVRELAEEVGIKADKKELKLIGRKRIAQSRFGWPKMNVTFFSFSCGKNQTIRISRPFEIVDAQWFDVDDLPEGTSPTVRKALSLTKEAKN